MGLFTRALSVDCHPVREAYSINEPLMVRVEITNLLDTDMKIPSVGIPWQSYYAIDFRVKNVRGFRRVYPEVLPLELPDTHVPAGGSVSGEVDLGRYLVTPTGESIASRPGEYEIEATVKTFLPKPGGGEKMQKLRCKPFVVKIVAEKE